MPSQIKKFALNFFILTVPSILLFFIIVEIFVRLFLSPGNIPSTRMDPLLGNQNVPNQTGVFIEGEPGKIEVRGKYRINNVGWNSPHEYVKDKNGYRIAVIGDSYVEALQIDYDKSYPYLLEKKINKQVYSFGHSGTNLIQYLNVLRYISREYEPDLVIINMVHNDFMESIYGYGRKDGWTVMKNSNGFVEMAPQRISNMYVKNLLKKSALIRYLIVNLRMQKWSKIIKNIFYAETRQKKISLNVYEANVDINDIEKVLNKKLTDELLDYIFGEYLKAQPNLWLVIDTNRQAIYAGMDPRKTAVHFFNEAAINTADRKGIPIIDITNIFEQDWKINHKRFEYKVDNHWNGYAHTLVAETIEKKLKKLNVIN